MNTVDYIIIGLMLLSLANGFRKGLIVSLFSLGGTVIGITAAYRFYPTMVQWAQAEFGLLDKMSGFFKSYQILPQALQQLQIGKFSLASLGVPQFLALVILNICSFLIIWAVVSKTLLLVAYIFSSAIRATPISGLERAGGALLSLVLMVFTISLVFGLLNPILSVSGSLKGGMLASAAQAISGSKFYPFFIKVYALLVGQLDKFWPYNPLGGK